MLAKPEENHASVCFQWVGGKWTFISLAAYLLQMCDDATIYTIFRRLFRNFRKGDVQQLLCFQGSQLLSFTPILHQLYTKTPDFYEDFCADMYNLVNIKKQQKRVINVYIQAFEEL